MKYAILIGDGIADYPIDALGGKTPLEKASTPNMDYIAKNGMAGLVRTIPEGFSPGSDVANLSILGYDPKRYYTGRSPLEAASIGVRLGQSDVSFRCNLVTLKRRDGDLVMEDFSAGHISTEEARQIIKDIEARFGKDQIHFYPGVSYRHLMVWRNGPNLPKTTPPHDIMGKAISDYLPTGSGSSKLIEVMNLSQRPLEEHPINIERMKKGLNPANSLWLWGEGRPPNLPTLKERFSIDGSVISAVDLIKGIGIYAGLEVINVPGATGYIDTNYKGKAEYALKALEKKDLVVVHVEAPDEASHNGDLDAKIKAIEDFDREVVGRVLKGIKGFERFKVLLICDHRTPLRLRTHTDGPVPFAIFPSPYDISTEIVYPFSEGLEDAGVIIEEGHTLVETFLFPSARVKSKTII